jgi:hypothetical protein
MRESFISLNNTVS